MKSSKLTSTKLQFFLRCLYEIGRRQTNCWWKGNLVLRILNFFHQILAFRYCELFLIKKILIFKAILMIILTIYYIRLINFKMSYLGLSKVEDFSSQYTNGHRYRLKIYENHFLYRSMHFPDGRHLLTTRSGYRTKWPSGSCTPLYKTHLTSNVLELTFDELGVDFRWWNIIDDAIITFFCQSCVLFRNY